MPVFIFAGKYLHMMQARRDVFQAIADPTRRQIIGLVSQKPVNINFLSERFDMARQSVTLHVKILEECGLVRLKKVGREKYCEARLKKLREVSVWVEQYKQFFEGKLDDLEIYLDKLQKKQKHGKRKK